jgi:hypothetical protein
MRPHGLDLSRRPLNPILWQKDHRVKPSDGDWSGTGRTGQPAIAMNRASSQRACPHRTYRQSNK